MPPSLFNLDALNFGYKILFSREPTSVFFTNNRSCLDESDFVESGIPELLIVGSIVSCTSPPDMVNPRQVFFTGHRSGLQVTVVTMIKQP